MTDATILDQADTLKEADELVNQLETLLDQEFEALKIQDLDQFELLLSGKNHLLVELSRLTGVNQFNDADKLGPIGTISVPACSIAGTCTGAMKYSSCANWMRYAVR